MKQLIEELKNGKVRVIDAPVPQCGSHELLVHNRYSLISPGTEKLMIEMGQKSLAGKAMARPDLVTLAYEKAKREGFLNVFREAMARLDQPLPLGYSSAGTIIEIGREVKNFAVGDEVACAGAGFASHAEMVAVPETMCVKTGAAGESGGGVPSDEAAFVMLGGIALQGIRSANLTFGENIVVVGLGLIGLLTVQIARAYGCMVIGIDIDPAKVALSKKMGAEHALTLGVDDIESYVRNVTNGAGTDVVILTAATEDNGPVVLAENIARKRGRIVLVGVSELKLTRKSFWDKELEFTVSKASGPSPNGAGHALFPPELVRWTEQNNLREFVRLQRMGAVTVRELITHRIDLCDVLTAYEMILKRTEPFIGVLISYPRDVPKRGRVEIHFKKPASPAQQSAPDRRTLGVIGGGMFTKNILLPVVKKIPHITFAAVATKTGVTSRHMGDSFGFGYATTEYADILQNDTIGSVIITTRHNLHAKMVADAIRAGKHVYVEKPLCITPSELEMVAAEFHAAKRPGMFMVGFNRRYSPLSSDLKNVFESRTAPLQINFRVNAGYIPPDHWTQDAGVGGGRIIGEVCHMVDYLTFLTDSRPVEVYAGSVHPGNDSFLAEDNVQISIQYADGSLGTIFYTALGSKLMPRERVEVYCEGRVGILDDFRTLETVRNNKKKKKSLRSQDMGYYQEMIEFFTGASESGALNAENAMMTTRTTFAAVESLQTHKPVTLADVVE